MVPSVDLVSNLEFHPISRKDKCLLLFAVIFDIMMVAFIIFLQISMPISCMCILISNLVKINYTAYRFLRKKKTDLNLFEVILQKQNEISRLEKELETLRNPKIATTLGISLR